MYTKKNARVTFRSNRRPNFKRNNNFSNGKNRNKGNVSQQYNKYLKLAKEASSSGDRIQSEYYYQFTDHYYRLMIELGINIEDNDSQEDTKSDSISEEDSGEENNIETDSGKDEVDEKEIPKKEIKIKEKDNEIESIESIPFISKPAKKKSSRVKKITA
tara:strand:+ start:532 stop:1008 length:477 start_codon:yes stop_codon:yes gene_type:complete